MASSRSRLRGFSLSTAKNLSCFIKAASMLDVTFFRAIIVILLYSYIQVNIKLDIRFK